MTNRSASYSIIAYCLTLTGAAVTITVQQGSAADTLPEAWPEACRFAA